MGHIQEIHGLTARRSDWSSKRWLIPVVVCAALILALGAEAKKDQALANKPHPYAAFPLWKDVSGNGPFATLDEGQLPNGTRWGAYASRVGAGRAGYERPCLSIARITSYGLYGQENGCSIPTPAPAGSMALYLDIAFTYQTRPDGPFIGETILGLTFQPTVKSVVLKYADGGELRRRTRFFNSKQQKNTKLPPFRYVALAMMDDVCVEQVVGYSDTGAELFSAETGLCF
jgi:hypothetical protein